MPFFPLSAASAGLLVDKAQAAVGGWDAFSGGGEDDVVAGRVAVAQLGLETRCGSGQRFFGKHRQRAHQPPIAVVLAQQAAYVHGHLLPQAVELRRPDAACPRQRGDVLRQAV